MDQSTQQNAAMVEETSAAARNLTAEVGSLAEQAALFNTGENVAAPTVERVSPPRSAAPKVRKTAPAAHQPSVKALPAMAGGGGGHDDWNAF
jgi:methyl-accepting chemotaxis protein